MFFPAMVILLGIAVCLLLWRIVWVLRYYHYTIPTRRDDEKCAVAVFLGSGGHSSEMISMLSALDFNRYTPRIYITSEGDILSAEKAHMLERTKTREGSRTKTYSIFQVPRARRVHQSLIATPPTALRSLVACFTLIMTPALGGTDILLLNGPGTCAILCLAILVCRVIGLKTPRMIYIESFARVNSLSLSGKLIRPLVDRFVVQWPQLVKPNSNDVCKGWLV